MSEHADEVVFEPPAPPEDTSGWGRHIGRSMTLLATSTPEHRNTVRILFYGQSIIKQDWWKGVVADLKRRFPHAEIQASNLAIGGFASQRLVRSADMDLYPFYPDLLIFHVFGAHDKYEEIIANTRRRTTAEIAMANDHFTAKADPRAPDAGWTAFMNGQFLPATAAKYGCELIDVRGPWRKYLLDKGYAPQKLLLDGAHLNEHACYLMAELVGRQLVYDPALPDDEWRDMVRTYEVGSDVDFEDGVLRLHFEGNRVVALAGEPDGKAAPGRVLIDGRKPSSFAELYAFTRANVSPEVDWPWGVSAPFRITSVSPPVEEDWTITVTEGDVALFKFRIQGSVTGPDGEGVSTERFESDSGRVVIEPDDWWKSTGGGKPSPIRPGYELEFRCVLTGTDVYEAPAVEDPSREYGTVLAQGLTNGPHVLEIRPEGDGSVPLKAIRVYEPPLK